MSDEPLTTIAQLRDDLARATRTRSPGIAVATARTAIDALDRITSVRPGAVFELLDQLRGEGVAR